VRLLYPESLETVDLRVPDADCVLIGVSTARTDAVADFR
jgi:hypothetical protein